jgi:hypothetical protein
MSTAIQEVLPKQKGKLKEDPQLKKKRFSIKQVTHIKASKKKK